MDQIQARFYYKMFREIYYIYLEVEFDDDIDYGFEKWLSFNFDHN